MWMRAKRNLIRIIGKHGIEPAADSQYGDLGQSFPVVWSLQQSLTTNETVLVNFSPNHLFLGVWIFY